MFQVHIHLFHIESTVNRKAVRAFSCIARTPSRSFLIMCCGRVSEMGLNKLVPTN